MKKSVQALTDLRELLHGRGVHVTSRRSVDEGAPLVAETVLHLDGDCLTRLREDVANDDLALSAHAGRVNERLMAVHRTVVYLRRALSITVLVVLVGSFLRSHFPNPDWWPLVVQTVGSVLTAWGIHIVARPVGFWVIRKVMRRRLNRVVKKLRSA